MLRLLFTRVERSHWLSFNQSSCFHLISYRVPFNLSNFRWQWKFNKHLKRKKIDGTNLTRFSPAVSRTPRGGVSKSFSSQSEIVRAVSALYFTLKFLKPAEYQFISAPRSTSNFTFFKLFLSNSRKRRLILVLQPCHWLKMWRKLKFWIFFDATNVIEEMQLHELRHSSFQIYQILIPFFCVSKLFCENTF